MSDIDTKILDDFWMMQNLHHYGRLKSDFEVRWREGYAFYYDVIDKSTGKSVMSMHADVVDYNLGKDKILSEIQKATAQIASGDYEDMDIDNDGPKSNVEPKHVSEWLKDFEK